ncbi:LysE family translocator [Streptomyces sp. NPDC053720]|uniref:LysE family translocator n=1 Tax=Streptomyces sp. NPDC053720 TaxID=3154855 RepID=UPI0034169B5F
MAAVTPLTLIPGTSFTLVTQQVIAGSRSDGLRASLGSACGLLVHATFAAIGLSALVMSSAQALTVVKILGGIYLIWLGVTTWRSAGRGVEPMARRRWRLPWAQLGGFGQGLWSNVLNPKAASVYLTLVPQFLTSSHHRRAFGRACGRRAGVAVVLDVCGRRRTHGNRHTSIPTWDESPGGSRAGRPWGSNSNGGLSPYAFCRPGAVDEGEMILPWLV